jgi:hypothetical protein
MKLQVLVCAAALLAAPAVFADDSDERAKLNGAWQSQEQTGGVWTIQDQGSGMHLTNSLGDKKIFEFACDLAKECQVKDAGKNVKVTVYFNGAKLVLTETRGDQVFKRRFGIAQTGDVLEIETIWVVPDGKTETIHLTRVQTAAVKSAKP